MKRVTKKQLKQIRELLRDKKARDDANLFVLEGAKIVKDALTKGHKLQEIIVSGKFADQNKILVDEIRTRNIPILISSHSDIGKISSLKHPESILAVAAMPKHRQTDILTSRKNPIKILLDNVQDPGNLGAIIRLSCAFGIHDVFLYGECADIYNPKTIRSSAGTVLDVNISRYDLKRVKMLKEQGNMFFAADTAGEDIKKVVKTIKKGISAVLIFGSEGQGISAPLLKIADRFLTIPIKGTVDSLNVVSAVSIALYIFTEIWWGHPSVGE